MVIVRRGSHSLIPSRSRVASKRRRAMFKAIPAFAAVLVTFVLVMPTVTQAAVLII
jgi:hypothetical protein